MIFRTLYGIFRYCPTQMGTVVRSWLVKKCAKSCGKRLVVQPGVQIRGMEYLEIGDDVNLNDNCYVNALGGMRIGNGCRIAMNTVLLTETHNFERRDVPIFTQKWSYAPLEICDDVWVGANVVITMGHKIGKGSIIAAGAVVTQDIPEYQIWGGIPAKKIKDRP